MQTLKARHFAFLCLCVVVCIRGYWNVRLFVCTMVCMYPLVLDRIILYEVLHGTRRWLSGGVAHCRSEVSEYSFPQKLFHDIFCLSRLVVSSGRLYVACRIIFRASFMKFCDEKELCSCGVRRVRDVFSMPPEFYNNASSRWPHYSFAHLFIHSFTHSFVHPLVHLHSFIFLHVRWILKKKILFHFGALHCDSKSCRKFSKRTIRTGWLWWWLII